MKKVLTRTEKGIGTYFGSVEIAFSYKFEHESRRTRHRITGIVEGKEIGTIEVWEGEGELITSVEAMEAKVKKELEKQWNVTPELQSAADQLIRLGYRDYGPVDKKIVAKEKDIILGNYKNQ